MHTQICYTKSSIIGHGLMEDISHFRTLVLIVMTIRLQVHLGMATVKEAFC